MNTVLWKRKIGRALSLMRALGAKPTSSRDVILLYHSVAGGGLAVPFDRFRAQMDWLKDHARVVSVDTMLRVPNDGARRVALTFDDGYRTLRDVVHPVLDERHFSATVCITTGMIGERDHLVSRAELGHYPDEEFLCWDDVRFLVEHGWIFGGHGVDHVDLTHTSTAETRGQLGGCKSAIESKTGARCDHFAYTWGRHDQHVRQAVEEAGFLNALAGVHGPVTRGSDPFALPRIDIRAEYELRDFADAVTGAWDFLGVKQTISRIFQ